MAIHKKVQLFLICSVSLFSTYTFADKPSENSVERTDVATEHRIKTEQKATIEAHRALAERQHLESSREDSSEDNSDDDTVDAEEQKEEAER